MQIDRHHKKERQRKVKEGENWVAKDLTEKIQRGWVREIQPVTFERLNQCTADKC